LSPTASASRLAAAAVTNSGSASVPVAGRTAASTRVGNETASPDAVKATVLATVLALVLALVLVLVPAAGARARAGACCLISPGRIQLEAVATHLGS